MSADFKFTKHLVSFLLKRGHKIRINKASFHIHSFITCYTIGAKRYLPGQFKFVKRVSARELKFALAALEKIISYRNIFARPLIAILP